MNLEQTAKDIISIVSNRKIDVVDVFTFHSLHRIEFTVFANNEDTELDIVINKNMNQYKVNERVHAIYMFMSRKMDYQAFKERCLAYSSEFF